MPSCYGFVLTEAGPRSRLLMNSDPNQKVFNFFIKNSYIFDILICWDSKKTSMVPPEASNQCCETTSFWCWSGLGFPVLMPNQIRIRIVVDTMLILMRILPQDLHMSENLNFFTFSHSIASLQCFIVLISVECVIIFSILDSILKFSGTSLVYQLFHLLGNDTVPDPAKWCGSTRFDLCPDPQHCLQPSEESIQHCNSLNDIWLFYLFVGHFFLPGSGIQNTARTGTGRYRRQYIKVGGPVGK